MAMGETPITVIGNLTDDPELRFTASGAAQVRFTVASTPRRFDREANQWKDGTTMFLRCSAWRSLAEHIADSLTKGTRVVVSGRMRQFDWQNDQGENRSMLVLEADDVGPSLVFATAAVTKATGNGSKASGGGKPAGDPWNTGAPAATDWNPAPAAAGGDEPPF